MHELEVAAKQGIAHGDVGQGESALCEEVVDVGRGHALGEGLDVGWQDVLEEGGLRRREAGGGPVAMNGGGFEGGVGRVGLEWGCQEALALGDLSLCDLLVKMSI